MVQAEESRTRRWKHMHLGRKLEVDRWNKEGVRRLEESAPQPGQGCLCRGIFLSFQYKRFVNEGP